MEARSLHYERTYSLYRRVQTGVCRQGHSVRSVADRLGVSTKSIYDWIKLYGDKTGHADQQDKDEIRRLKAELRRVTEERDILKKATAFFAKNHG